MSEKRKIVIQDVLNMLKDGKSRKEINEYYQLNPREAKELWKHPSLMNKKPAKYSVGIELVDEMPVQSKPTSAMEGYSFETGV